MASITIFQILSIFRSKEHSWYENSSQEDRKVFSPYMCLLWMGFTKKENTLLLLNDYVNKYVFSLHKHPELLWHLFCAIGDKKFEKLSFVKKEGNKKFSKTRELLSSFYGAGEREVNIYLQYLTYDDILDIASFMGCDKEELSVFKKEWS